MIAMVDQLDYSPVSQILVHHEKYPLHSMAPSNGQSQEGAWNGM